MAAILHAALWFGSLLPHVESPWPSRIGLSFPFTIAGAGELFKDFVESERRTVGRRWSSIEFGRLGFAGGWTIYFVSLVIQLESST